MMGCVVLALIARCGNGALMGLDVCDGFAVALATFVDCWRYAFWLLVQWFVCGAYCVCRGWVYGVILLFVHLVVECFVVEGLVADSFGLVLPVWDVVLSMFVDVGVLLFVRASGGLFA